MSRRTGKHRIYMNVGYDLTEQQLRDFFNQYGAVTDVYLPKHKSGRNKGFGFTTFDSEEALQSALSAQEYMIGGDVVKINRAGPRPEYEAVSDMATVEDTGTEADAANRQPQLFGKGPRLYVGGVPEELTEERLKDHFSRWGNVVDLYFPGKKGQTRVNYCFVTFDNWRAAQRACNQSERNIDGLVCSPPASFVCLIHCALACCCVRHICLTCLSALQPLQSINLAQERTAEQEQQARAEALAALTKSESTPLPAAGGFNLAGLGQVPNLALMQHLQLQAQVQAQQLGYTPQQQAQLQSLFLGQGTANTPSLLASYPAAHQQMLNSMLAQQNTGSGAPSPLAGMHHSHSSAPMHPYDLSSAASPSPGPYPVGLGNMSVEQYQLLAAQAQATDKHATDMHMLPQPTALPDSLSHLAHGMPPALGPSAAKLPSAAAADLAARMSAYMGGWGGAPGALTLPDNPSSKEVNPGFVSHPEFFAQASANVRAAAAAQPGNPGMSPLPYGGEQWCVCLHPCPLLLSLSGCPSSPHPLLLQQCHQATFCHSCSVRCFGDAKTSNFSCACLWCIVAALFCFSLRPEFHFVMDATLAMSVAEVAVLLSLTPVQIPMPVVQQLCSVWLFFIRSIFHLQS